MNFYHTAQVHHVAIFWLSGFNYLLYHLQITSLLAYSYRLLSLISGSPQEKQLLFCPLQYPQNLPQFCCCVRNSQPGRSLYCAARIFHLSAPTLQALCFSKFLYVHQSSKDFQKRHKDIKKISLLTFYLNSSPPCEHGEGQLWVCQMKQSSCFILSGFCDIIIIFKLSGLKYNLAVSKISGGLYYSSQLEQEKVYIFTQNLILALITGASQRCQDPALVIFGSFN